MTPKQLYARIDKTVDLLMALGAQLTDGRAYIESRLKAAGVNVDLPQLKSPHQDAAVACFCNDALSYTNVPYRITAHDMVELSALRRSFGIGADGIPLGWSVAIENLFKSPLSCYKMADMCVRDNVFVNSAVDRYGKPTAHNGNGQSNTEAARDFIRRRTKT